MKSIAMLISAIVLWSGFFMLVSLGIATDTPTLQSERQEDSPKYLVPSALSQENMPCSKCHNYRAEDRNKRELLEYHTDIELIHAEEQRWCYDCHEGDRLRLQNGQVIEFSESQLLCGQCHGTVFRDWKAGIHGKRSGSWDGDKLYRVCSSCHDPHQPKFKPIKPNKPPIKPSDI